MHQYYEVRPQSKLFKNQDEVNPRHSELDYTLVSPHGSTVLEIGSDEAYVWQELEKGTFVPEIVASLSMFTGKFELGRVEKLIDFWESLGLVKPPISKWEDSKRPWFMKLLWSQVSFDRPDRFLKFFYQVLGKYFFSTLGAAVLFGVVLLGMLVGLDAYFMDNIVLARDLGTLHFGFFLLLALGSLSLHELGHAMAMIWTKAEIIRAGVGLYIGIPVFFVDTSAVWCKPKNKRIITASAGMIVNATIASISVLLTLVVPSLEVKAILWELAVVNLFQFGFSLIPFVKMDGYYILVDLLGIPNLNSSSLEELNQVVHHPRKFEYSRHHNMMLAYGSLSILTGGLILLYSISYWMNLLF